MKEIYLKGAGFLPLAAEGYPKEHITRGPKMLTKTDAFTVIQSKINVNRIHHPCSPKFETGVRLNRFCKDNVGQSYFHSFKMATREVNVPLQSQGIVLYLGFMFTGGISQRQSLSRNKLVLI